MRVSLHVWRVPRRKLPATFVRLARDPRRLRAMPGVKFAKLLGTADGFGPADADLTRYAAVIVADREVPFEPRERESWARLDLVPVHSRGSWSGQEPFTPAGRDHADGMAMALTRARLRPTRAPAFWTAIRPVAQEAAAAPGLLARFGIGEAPIGWQGTVSVWRNAADLKAFAYRQPQHRAVIARTPTDRWYAEDLFARFAVRDIVGDRAVLSWCEGGQGGR